MWTVVVVAMLRGTPSSLDRVFMVGPEISAPRAPRFRRIPARRASEPQTFF